MTMVAVRLSKNTITMTGMTITMMMLIRVMLMLVGVMTQIVGVVAVTGCLTMKLTRLTEQVVAASMANTILMLQ